MKKNLRYILIFFLIVLVIIGIYFGLKEIKTKSINCESQYGPCSDSVNRDLEKYRGISISKSLSDIKKVLSKNNKVSEFSVRYIFPNMLSVYVVEKKGEVALGKQGVDEFIILDKTGQVIEKTKNTSLPIINITTSENTDYKLGSKVSENLIFALQLERLIFSSYGVKLISLYNDRIETKLNNGPKVIFPVEGEIDVLMGSLNLILSRLNNQTGEIRIGEVDLRYKNPVIR